MSSRGCAGLFSNCLHSMGRKAAATFPGEAGNMGKQGTSCGSTSHCLDKLSDLSAACKDLPRLLCLSCTSIQEDLLPQQQPESREQESDQQKRRDHRALCDFLQRHEN